MMEGESKTIPSPETRLWKAVITQALMDATTASRKQEQQSHRRKALMWLDEEDQDFQYVCELADMEVETVRKVAKHVITRGGVWRVTEATTPLPALPTPKRMQAKQKPSFHASKPIRYR
jgi:hypothetical protein